MGARLLFTLFVLAIWAGVTHLLYLELEWTGADFPAIILLAAFVILAAVLLFAKLVQLIAWIITGKDVLKDED